MTEDRIRLAEAMGWTTKFNSWLRPGCDPAASSSWCTAPPDPFTYANDDYQVLEWMRSFQAQVHDDLPDGGYLVWKDFSEELCDTGPKTCYEIGDFARAALEVIDGQ